MKVSLIIPTRDRAQLLPETIRSALAQSLPAHEIIIVDDGSQDDTASVATSFGTKVRFLRQSRGGKSRALNAGFILATGEAVLVLDDDDLLPPRALEQHVAELVRFPGAHFSFGRHQRFYGAAPVGPIRDLPHPDVEHVPLDDTRRTVVKLMEHSFLPHSTWLARRAALEQAGPYDEAALRSQDFDMILRLARSDEGAFVDDIVLYKREHGGSRPGVLASTGTDDIHAAWVLHDQQIFARIARNWGLADFRPFLRAPHPAHAERTSWLQKGVLLFPRRCYSEAFDALETYRGLLGDDTPDPVETNIASRLLLRPIGSDLLDSGARRLRVSLRNANWPLKLRQAFVRGGRWQIRSALKAREYNRALHLSRFMIEAFGPSGVAVGFIGTASSTNLFQSVHVENRPGACP